MWAWASHCSKKWFREESVRYIIHVRCDQILWIMFKKQGFGFGFKSFTSKDSALILLTNPSLGFGHQ